MVLTKEELIASLQNEVRILVHLAGKVDPAHAGYRPSPKQRTTLELLQYLSAMGPNMIRTIKAGAFDPAAFQPSQDAAKAMNLEQVVAAIGTLSGQFADLLNPFTESDFRGKIELFGRNDSRGSLIVNLVLSAYAAYRTQLFLYLKACGREELNTMNLWAGMDAA